MASGPNSTARSKWKTPLFALFVIFTNAFGNFFIARGMRRFPSLDGPADVIRAIFTPWVALGVILLITWLLTRMMFLSFADLSYMVPLTSLGYVLSVLLGHFFLHEQITPQRWAGTVLITVGMMFVSLGDPNTTRRAEAQSDTPEVARGIGVGGGLSAPAEGEIRQ